MVALLLISFVTKRLRAASMRLQITDCMWQKLYLQQFRWSACGFTSTVNPVLSSPPHELSFPHPPTSGKDSDKVPPSLLSPSPLPIVTAVFSVVFLGSILCSRLWGGALQDDTRNSCVANYPAPSYTQMIDFIHFSQLYHFMWTCPVWVIHLLEFWIICSWSLVATPLTSSTWDFPLYILVLHG